MAGKYEKIAKRAKQFLAKIICVFDDIPFLLKSILPKGLLSIGSYVLAGAGFLVFPVELFEGIKGLRKAKKEKNKVDPLRKMRTQTNIVKIGFASAGILISAALLAFTIVGLAVFESAFSVLIPAAVCVISCVEWYQKLSAYLHEKTAKTERKLAFASVYAWLSFVVVSLAIISTLSTLGVLTLGIAPTIALITVVGVALAVKIFELIDKKKGGSLTTSIKEKFTSTYQQLHDHLPFNSPKPRDPAISPTPLKTNHDSQPNPTTRPAPTDDNSSDPSATGDLRPK